MNLLPRSLFGRNVLLMLALIAIAQIASAIIYRQYVQRPRAIELAAVTALYISAFHAAQVGLKQDSEQAPGQVHGPEQDQAQDQAQRALLTRIEASGHVRVVQSIEPSVRFEVPRSPIIRDYLAALAAQLRNDPLARNDDVHWHARPGPGVWVHTAGVDGSPWIVFNADRFELDVSWWWLAIPWLITALAFAGAYVIQRRINRPLSELAHATDRVGRGERAAILPVDGPTEIAAVARSFNRMTASLEQTERERALMLAGLSHDLRTPLTKLRLSLAMLDATVDADLHRSMEKAIEDIDANLGQLLDYARSGDEEVATPGDLAALLQALTAEFAAQGHAFETAIDALPRFAYRPIAMRRLFANLMQNAVRYGRAGLELRANAEQDRVVVGVLDRGPGIPEDSGQRAKQPFVRLDGHAGVAGTGLGLAIAERIVSMHGGELRLLSRESGGLEARVTLPLR